MSDTDSISYTHRLVRIQGGVVKRLLTPVNPYRWNIRRVCRGRVLDVGCGIGRNLKYLGDKQNVGVDHNPDSVKICQEAGFQAFTPVDFFGACSQEKFQTLLLSHVIEHMTPEQAKSVINEYLPYMGNGSQIVLICPQQRGYASDATHVTYFDEENLHALLRQLGFGQVSYRSFPFPRVVGRIYIYNEHIVTGQLDAG